jgi:hypothetical protein
VATQAHSVGPDQSKVEWVWLAVDKSANPFATIWREVLQNRNTGPAI